MLDLIEEFIKNYFTEELQYEIKRTFTIFEQFEYKEYEFKFDCLHDNDLDSNTKINMFMNDLNNCVDFIINEHKIILNKDISLHIKNELMTCLYNLMFLDDYVPILRVLESLENNEEKLYTIISDNSNLDIVTLYEIIESFDPTILDILKQYADVKDTVDNHVVSEEVKNYVRNFFECFGTNNLGYQLVYAGVLIDVSFEEYLPFIEESIIGSSDEETALNIYSVLILSTNGRLDPVKIYRDHSLDLLESIIKTSIVDTYLGKHISKFSEFLEIKKQSASVKENNE